MIELVEREQALKSLREGLREAAVRGRVALVAGEAGVGKTSILRAAAREHGTRGPVWWGICDALETPSPLAPLFDIARENRPRFSASMSGPDPRCSRPCSMSFDWPPLRCWSSSRMRTGPTTRRWIC
jgi:hypothetical protein